MSSENYWTRRVSRRGVVRGAAFAGVGLAGAALIGCGGDDDGGATPSAPAGTAPASDGTQPQATTAPEPVKRGGRLRRHQAADTPNFDMHANSTYAVNHATAPAYNLLVQFDPAEVDESEVTIIPDLAESWEFTDGGQRVVFNLVKNGKFHNGQAFTSADVKATFERIIDPPAGVVSPRQDQFGAVAGIDTPDDYTVVFNLSRPAPSLLPIIATGWNVIYSAEDIANDVDFKDPGSVNGTGPFRLKEYLRGNRLVMDRFEDYHHDTFPYLDGITNFIVPDGSTALTSFQSGELDFHYGPSASDREAIAASMPDAVIDGPMPGLGFGCLNWNLREPWTDIRVRQALTVVIDREASIAVYGQGFGFLGGYFQPSGPWAISTEELHTIPGYNLFGEAAVAEARKLLDAAGVPQGFETTFMVRKLVSYERLALFVQDQWRKVGVNAKIDIQETAAAYDIMNARNFDIVPWGHGYALEDPDALFAEFYLQDSPRNYSEIGSQEVDDLFLKQSTEMDPEARLQLVHQMEKAALPLFSKSIQSWNEASEAKHGYVKNRVKHAGTYNNNRFERVWLDR
jgi:peptide/nickel transport system substrate-binding protein